MVRTASMMDPAEVAERSQRFYALLTKALGQWTAPEMLDDASQDIRTVAKAFRILRNWSDAPVPVLCVTSSQVSRMVGCDGPRAKTILSLLVDIGFMESQGARNDCLWVLRLEDKRGFNKFREVTPQSLRMTPSPLKAEIRKAIQ